MLAFAGALWAQPAGAPPDGMPPGPPPGNASGPGGPPPGEGRGKLVKISGAFTLSAAKTARETSRKFTSAEQDVSAVLATGKSQLALVDCEVTTTGGTSSQENSSFYGQNAAVLANDGAILVMRGGRIITKGSGANGAFAAGRGARVELFGVAIDATADGGHGAMCAGGGELVLKDVNIVTRGEHGAALATDRGSGTIEVTGGRYETSGPGSPALYSTGRLTVQDATLIATGSEAAVIEGRNSIVLRDCVVRSEKLCGVMIYQSFSGDAEGQHGVFTMTGGELSVAQGAAFYVNNTRATVTLKGVKLAAGSGKLVEAAAGRWGRQGANGGHAEIVAYAQTLQGDLTADAISSLSLSLAGKSVLNGAIQNGALTLDASSTWQVTGDSVLTTLTVAGNNAAGLVRIEGHGHSVTYDAAKSGNAWLAGKTYPLAGGGELRPRQ